MTAQEIALNLITAISEDNEARIGELAPAFKVARAEGIYRQQLEQWRYWLAHAIANEDYQTAAVWQRLIDLH